MLIAKEKLTIIVFIGELINIRWRDITGTMSIPRTRRRFSMREGQKAIRGPDRRSKIISAPTNFNHISHMGPGDGIQIQRLLDLPTTVETADSMQPTKVTITQFLWIIRANQIII